MALTFLQAKNANQKFGTSTGDLINKYVEAVRSSGKWRNSIQELDVAIYPWDDNGITRNQITLPMGFESIVGARFALTQGYSGNLSQQTQWYRYVNSTSNTWGWWNSRTGENQWSNGCMFDLGFFSTYRDIANASALTFTTFYNEAGNSIAVRGNDTDGRPIYTGSPPNVVNGVVTNLTSLLITTSQTFGVHPLQVVKSMTNGPVKMYYSDTNNVAVQIGEYAPSETVPQYRRYAIPNNNQTVMRVAAKLAYVPLVADNDLVIPDNGVALSRGLEALTYEDAHDEAASYYWGLVYEMLNANLREYQGNAPRTINIRGTSNYGAMYTMQ